MGTPLLHAKSSVRRHGGKVEDYINIHKWFDSTKGHYGEFRHRAILHNTFGMLLAEQVFGDFIVNSDGKQVEVRQIAYEHIIEDCGFVPTVKDWLEGMAVQPWMMRSDETRKIKKEIELSEIK